MSVAARGATVVAATAWLALLAACGGSQSGGAARLGSTASQSNGAVSFARCMRSSGVPSYPDPTGSGLVKESLEQLGVSSSRFQAAERACNHLLPNGGRPPDQAQVQRVKAKGLAFSRCVRAHGVPGFPDPGSDGRIPDPATVGIDQGSPTFEAANSACGRYRPPYMPSNSAYNAYARTNGG